MKRLSIIGSMASHKIIHKISIIILAVVTLLGVPQITAFACTPVPITPWFTEELSFVETNLPSTVNHPSELKFLNSEDSPFYFLYNGETRDMGTQLLFHIFVYEDNDLIDVNKNYFSEFEHRNMIGDNRPENTLSPDYQDVIIPVTLDEKQYAIKLRITYEINQNYDPKSVEKQDIKCPYENSFLLNCFTPPIIDGMAFLTVLVIVVIIRKKSLGNPNGKNL
jgi:hypothetical protein